MSELQQKAIRMISGLSDDNVSFLIDIINRLIPQSESGGGAVLPEDNAHEKMQAFLRLDAARAEISRYLPADFDPERELSLKYMETEPYDCAQAEPSKKFAAEGKKF